MLRQRTRVELREYSYIVDTGIGAIAESKIYYAVFAAEGDGRFGALGRQDAETLAGAACQYNS
jgi:hypothetical protein